MKYPEDNRQPPLRGRPEYNQSELRDPPVYHPGPTRGQQGYSQTADNRQRYYDLKANRGHGSVSHGPEYRGTPRYDGDRGKPVILLNSKESPRRGDNPYDNSYNKGGNQSRDLPNIDSRYRRTPIPPEQPNYDQRNFRRQEQYDQRQGSQGSNFSRQDSDRRSYPDSQDPQRGYIGPPPPHRGDQHFSSGSNQSTPRFSQPYPSNDQRNQDPFGPDPYYRGSDSPQYKGTRSRFSSESTHPPPKRVSGDNSAFRPYSDQGENGGNNNNSIRRSAGRRSEAQKPYSSENSAVQYVLRSNTQSKSSIRGSAKSRSGTAAKSEHLPQEKTGFSQDESKVKVKGIMSGQKSDLEKESTQKKTVEFQDTEKQLNIVAPLDTTKLDSDKKTVTSIGSKTGYDFPDVDDLDDVELDDIDGVYEGKDLYMCYLKTEAGALVGPMRLDIEDISMGLPKPDDDEPAGTEEGKTTLTRTHSVKPIQYW